MARRCLSLPGPTARRVQIEEACEPLLERFGLVDTTKDHLWTEEGSCKAMQWQWPLPNVWLGVSAEDQRRADERIPALLATPATIRFVSAEPLLGPIDFRRYLWASADMHGTPFPMMNGPRRGEFIAPIDVLHWIIVGGESGQGARPMHPDWARQIRDACEDTGTAFFFKQWGSWAPADLASEAAEDLELQDRYAVIGEQQFAWATKKAAGRILDGVEHNYAPYVAEQERAI